MSAPPGFIELAMGGEAGFNELCGPLWVRAEGNRLIGGFRVERRHCNPMGNCHGGMLATFADVHMVVASQFAHELPSLGLPTISLALDYLAPTLLGAWVEAVPEIVKVTRGMVFANEILTVDGQPVARASGIFKISNKVEPGSAPVLNAGGRLRALLKT